MRSSTLISSVIPYQSPLTWRHLPRWLRHSQSRCTYSTLPESPLIKARSIPAPHTGNITILTLSSPANKNAISRQLLDELSNKINAVNEEWDSYSGSRKDLSRRSKINKTSQSPSETPTDVEETSEGKGADGRDENKAGLSSIDKHLPGGALVPRDISTATRVLILASEVDSVFCAGADLKERSRMTVLETRAFLEQLRQTLSRLATLPIPTISAVSGFALGGGLELALATSFRVLATTATVGLPETRLGIIPGAGGTVRLKELVGRAKAAEMVLTGRRVGAKEAYALGICERLVEGMERQDGGEGGLKQTKEETLDAAVKMAEEICAGGPVAVGAALRAVGWGLPTKKSNWENQMYDRVIGTRDRDEALLAFSEKRKPKFTGS